MILARPRCATAAASRCTVVAQYHIKQRQVRAVRVDPTTFIAAATGIHPTILDRDAAHDYLGVAKQLEDAFERHSCVGVDNGGGGSGTLYR